MTVTVTYTPEHPSVGESVSFVVVAADADAPIVPTESAVGFGDPGIPSGAPMVLRDCHPVGYGPWEPPEAKADTHTSRFTHVYAQPGTYTAVVYEVSRNEAGCHDAYGSVGRGSAEVTVT
jgi:hypothetical protein